jgi:hypothetical protein
VETVVEFLEEAWLRERKRILSQGMDKLVVIQVLERKYIHPPATHFSSQTLNR